ncbi:MAG: DEAD/DEAH box helicase [Bacteroidetes bacterium]|nr:DEAD/DEAH box helicase [Bacteroidota bacterium]
MAEKFGNTWWGQQWLQSLNNIDYSNRLPRGAAYARKGAVSSIKITENQIHAKVQGSRPTPYKVDIILPPFFDPELGNFMDELATNPLIVSKLFNRELDTELLSMAERNGLKIFPQQWTDFKMQCSCPDWAVPCKHLAAVIYKVCAEIDNNPFLAFSLHRLDLIHELTKRGLFMNAEVEEIPMIKNLYFDKKQQAVTTNFDRVNAYQKLSFTNLSPILDSLLALLPSNPVFNSNTKDFKEEYRIILNRVVKNAHKIVTGKIDLQNFLQQAIADQNVNTHSKNKIVLTEDLIAIVQVNDETFSLPEFMLNLSLIPSNKTLDYQPSTAALHTLFYLSLHLIANGAIVPQIVQSSDKHYAIRWLPAMISKNVKHLVNEISAILPPDIFWWKTNKGSKPIQKDLTSNLLSIFLTEFVFLLGEINHTDILKKVFFNSFPYSFNEPGENALPGGIQTWLQKYYLTQGKYRPQLAVSEKQNEDFGIVVNIIDTEEKSLVPIAVGDIINNKEFDKKRIEILKSLTTIIEYIPGLENFIRSKGKDEIVLNRAAFPPFLFDMIPVIQLLDIDVMLPKALQHILKPKPSVKLKSKKGKSFLSLNELMEFEWQVAIGDTLMSEQEFRNLLKHSDGLLKYKSQYIYVDQNDLEKLHKHFTSEKENLSPFEMLRAALSGEYQGEKIQLDNTVLELINELSEVRNIPLPKGLNATLRPYQERGFSWMYRNAQIGFGSVIADDMGLGKTLQVITTILKYKEDGFLDKKKMLVIVPTGLLTNWQSELEKFAPSLKVCLFHGTGRKMDEEFDILLSSYGIARTESNRLKKMDWYSMVIDEAQNIKNQETQQAKAIKSIKADNFIAMSGTPVENRLSELWSIMDYGNRGVLGSVKEFQENFGQPIEVYNDKSVAEKLKKISAPFMMRRLKTDKSIISDLPDKIEMDCFGKLVPEQASLYQQTMEEAMKEIEAIEAKDKKDLFVRQGLVLQMILALKQICNHPTQYLKNNDLDSTKSGKLELLFDKLDSILDSGEKVLIFTQFKEMGQLLQTFISEKYKIMPLFYHGGNSIKQRQEMVENFQTNPADKVFILSLKAAGTGLNLTTANHVIHYDLWWNPAVEAQATDRAYRIGQKNNVMVHRFITKNTFEEQINTMIQSKKALSEMTVSTGENWIGNLSNKELKNLFEIK